MHTKATTRRKRTNGQNQLGEGNRGSTMEISFPWHKPKEVNIKYPFKNNKWVIPKAPPGAL